MSRYFIKHLESGILKKSLTAGITVELIQIKSITKYQTCTHPVKMVTIKGTKPRKTLARLWREKKET